MNHVAMHEFNPYQLARGLNSGHSSALEILAELRLIEQEIQQGIEELEGVLR